MSNPSNLYAEKIFSEHPLVLWALDDKLDYVSLVSEAQRDLSLWTSTNIFNIDITSQNFGQQFTSSITNIIEGQVPVGDTIEMTLKSPNILNFTDLDQDLKTFCFGTYFYPESPYIQSISIGYEYTDTTTSLIVEKTKTFPISIFNKWQFVSETFEIPNENTDLRLIIKIIAQDGGGSIYDYRSYINGISLGQWNENFNATSLGIDKIALPASINISSQYAVEAQAYGIEEFSGYYIVEQNALKSVNTSIPMVFGAKNLTSILPNNNNPSLIIPGKGFLNEAGRYKEYTVEFWLKVNSDTNSSKKIFGPISSSDGLYVDSGFLTLAINNNTVSHFVGEWFRPMLVDIRIIRNFATLLINGEEVGSLSFDTDSIDLASKLSEEDKDQDWLGFYAYNDVTPVEIDCVAIYPYQVSNVLAKRRFAYGQAVVSPEGINSAYGGVAAFIDYPFAKYAVNYSYPSFAGWSQGTFDNLTTSQTSLSAPNYELPEIFTDTKTIEDFYSDNGSIQSEDNKFFTFRPSGSWNNLATYINFNRFNFLGSQSKAVYGLFKENTNLGEQILFKIYNTSNSNSFKVIKTGSTISYLFTFNSETTTLHEETISSPSEIFAAGFNIDKLISGYGNNVATFFGNQNGLKMYCLGDETSTYSYTGKVYDISFCTEKNLSSINNLFDSYGILDHSETGALLTRNGSYTLFADTSFNSYRLNIGIAGYWQDYLPLTYFAKYVEDRSGNRYYDLDFIQFNIGSPSPSQLFEQEIISSWKYGESTYVDDEEIKSLQYEYSNPVVKSYAQLSNNLLTGWNDYEDMEQKALKHFEYNTESLPIRSFISLQYVEDGANSLDENFTITEAANEGGIVDFNLHPNWDITKFEVIDNTLIYPPTSVDFNDLAIVYSVEFNIRGILNKNINLQQLELCSQVLSQNSFNEVGTRFGTPLYPYKRSGFYFDYKSKNPFSIYKGSTPYLYLTRKSGIEIRGDFDTLINRGMSLPVNTELSSTYKISALQLWLRFDKDQLPGQPAELFEINYKDDTIEFYIIANSNGGDRAKIFAVSRNTGLPVNGISYYVNGLIAREPVLPIKQWLSLGVAFSSSLSFDAFLGSVNLNGPFVFNNIGYYRTDNLQQVQSRIDRPWSQIKETPFEELEWLYWKNNFNWDEVLTIATTDLYGVNPGNIYNTYTGTNKIIVDDEFIFNLDIDRVKVYSDTRWQSSTVSPL
jgi:hypothetical protein